LLLDEPSLGLAPVIVDRIYSSFTALRDQGIVCLVVEQNSDRVTQTCSRVIVLRRGRVILDGDPKKLCKEELHTAYFG
jgi:branched-chain amino acid transport system ATP-binding protein